MNNGESLLSTTVITEKTIKRNVDPRNIRKELWLLTPTQLLIQGQWWSKRSTQTLQMAQWRDRGVRMTLQSGQRSVGENLYRSSKKSSPTSVRSFPASRAEAKLYDKTIIRVKTADGTAK